MQDDNHSSPKSSDISEDLKVNQVAPSNSHEVKHEDVKNSENINVPTITPSVEQSNKPSGVPEGVVKDESPVHHTSPTNSANAHCIQKSVTMYNPSVNESRQDSKWGHTAVS